MIGKDIFEDKEEEAEILDELPEGLRELWENAKVKETIRMARENSEGKFLIFDEHSDPDECDLESLAENHDIDIDDVEFWFENMNVQTSPLSEINTGKTQQFLDELEEIEHSDRINATKVFDELKDTEYEVKKRTQDLVQLRLYDEEIEIHMSRDVYSYTATIYDSFEDYQTDSMAEISTSTFDELIEILKRLE